MAHKRWMHCTQVGLRSGRQMIYLINFFSQKVVTINKERDKETVGLVFKNEKQSYARVRLRLSVYLRPRFSKVPRNATELKRCMVIERRCSKKGSFCCLLLTSSACDRGVTKSLGQCHLL